MVRVLNITYERYLVLPIVLRPFQFGLGFPYNWCPFLSIQCFRSPSFTPSFLKSSSTSFIHLSLGHPLPLLPSNFPSKIFTDLVSFILRICPSHSNLRIFIMVAISWDLYLVLSSSLVLILHCHSPLLVHIFSSISFSPMLLTFFQFYLSASMSLLHMSQLIIWSFCRDEF